MPILIYNTGFEHGLGSTPTAVSASLVSPQTGVFSSFTGSPSVTAAAARSGGYGLRCASVAAAATRAQLPVPGGTVSVIRFYARLNGAYPTGSNIQLISVVHGGIASHLSIETTGEVAFTHSPGQTTGYFFPLDVWVRVDLRINATSAVARVHDVMFDGVSYGPYNVGTATGSLTTLQLGPFTSASAYSLDYDDVAVSSTSGDYPLGPGYSESVKPQFPGLTLNTSGVFVRDATATVITAADYARLDDDPMGQTTDYIRQTTGSSTQPGGSVGVYFGRGATPTETPQGVQAIAQYGAASTNANNCRMWAAANGVNTYIHGSSSTQPTIGSLGPVYATVQVSNGGVAWTESMVDNVMIYFGSGGGTDVNPIPRYDAFMLEVDWYVTPPPTSTPMPHPAHRQVHLLGR